MQELEEKKSETKDMAKVSMIVGTSVIFQQSLIELLDEYDSKGITEISTNTLRQLMSDSFVENMTQGFFAQMVNKGDFNE